MIKNLRLLFLYFIFGFAAILMESFVLVLKHFIAYVKKANRLFISRQLKYSKTDFIQQEWLYVKNDSA